MIKLLYLFTYRSLIQIKKKHALPWRSKFTSSLNPKDVMFGVYSLYHFHFEGIYLLKLWPIYVQSKEYKSYKFPRKLDLLIWQNKRQPKVLQLNWKLHWKSQIFNPKSQIIWTAYRQMMLMCTTIYRELLRQLQSLCNWYVWHFD